MTLLASAFLVGLLGGLHCLAMCGAFILAVEAHGGPAPTPPRSGQAGASTLLWAHAGRLMGYAGLGALAGSVGGTVARLDDLQRVQGALYLLANLTLLLIAVNALRGITGIPALEAAGRRIVGSIDAGALLGRALSGRRAPALRALSIGMLWGFVPCGLVYSVLALALFSGGAGAGALVMGALWVGTLPHLAAAGWTVGRARSKLGQLRLQRAIGLAMLAFAVLGLYRIFFAPHSAALALLWTLPG